MSEWWSKLKSMLTNRARTSAELREEIEAHLEMQVEENRACGMQEEEARRAARRVFGNAALIHEGARNVWMFVSLENLFKDLGYPIRMTRKNPGFAVVAVLTLAIGIAGITAMFTVIQEVLLKPLAFHDPDRIVSTYVNRSLSNLAKLSVQRARVNDSSGMM